MSQEGDTKALALQSLSKPSPAHLVNLFNPRVRQETPVLLKGLHSCYHLYLFIDHQVPFPLEAFPDNSRSLVRVPTVLSYIYIDTLEL